MHIRASSEARKGRHRRDFEKFDQFLETLAGHDRPLELPRQPFRDLALRLDETRHDAVHPDAEFARKSARQTFNAGLRRDVGRQPAEAEARSARTHVEDGAAGGGDARDDRLGNEELVILIDGQALAPEGRRHILDEVPFVVRRVIGENADRLHSLRRMFDE